MCGRFTLAISAKQLSEYVFEHYHIDDALEDFKPKYNIAPGSDIISVIHDGKNYRLGTLKWGFTPSMPMENKAFQMINAKAETIFEKPLFKKAVLERRCVILADSFYEWDKMDKQKAPRRILTTDQKIFPMAAIWNTTIMPDGSKKHTVAIVTVEANSLMSKLHDRMPVILDRKGETLWLNRDTNDEATLKALLTPYAANRMTMYPVTKKVNNTSFDDEACLFEIEEPDDTLF